MVENSGKVVEKATTAALTRAQVTLARDQLELAVYFRQLDVIAHRFSHGPPRRTAGIQ